MAAVIDSDQHLYEPRSLWADHVDPAAREEALAIVDDELGYAWLTWRGKRLAVADVQRPRDTAALGRHHERARQGLASEYVYDDELPPEYWDPTARLEQLTAMGLEGAVLFPELRPPLGTAAVGSPGRAHRQHGRLEPLVRHDLEPRARPTPPGRPPHAHRSRLARSSARSALGGRGAAGDDRPGGGRRSASLAPRARPAVVRIRRPRRHTALPRGRPTPSTGRGLLRRPRGRLRLRRSSPSSSGCLRRSR